MQLVVQVISILLISCGIGWYIHYLEVKKEPYHISEPYEEPETEFFFCGNATMNRSNDLFFTSGMTLFNANCASCHRVNVDMTGPALRGARERGVENAYEDWLYAFILNEDSLLKAGDVYTISLNMEWSSISFQHTFKSMTREDVDEIFKYVEMY